MTHPANHLCKTLERPVSTGALSLFNFADMNEDDPIIIASTENDPTDSLDFLGDIGNIDIPEVNLDFFDFDPEEEADTENRYVKPKLVPMKTDQVLYDNAAKLARELKITPGSRYDCIVSGSFIFGDFIEAFMVHNQCVAQKMTITTLSLSQENIDSLANLRTSGNCEQFTIEENPELHDFYEERFTPIIERFATIRKTAPRKTQWKDMTQKRFKT